MPNKRATRRRAARRTLAGLNALMAANACAGSWYAVRGAPNVPQEWLERTPFSDYRAPGVILGTIVGGSQAAAAVALAADHRTARPLATGASVVLLSWILTQLAMIGYRSPLQPAVLAWALGTSALSRRL